MFEFTVRQRLAALLLLLFLLLGGMLLFFQRDNQGYTEEYRVGESEPIYVHVCGAVVSPGIIKVKPGTRKYQALEIAGGALPEADLNRINLAEYVLDGEQVYLPKKGEVPPKTTGKRTVSTARKVNGNQEVKEKAIKVFYDLNSATQKELENVPGIGPALAARIIQFRTKNGKFTSYDDLQKVSGIGAAKLEQFRTYLFVK